MVKIFKQSTFSFRRNIRVKITVFFLILVITIASALTYLLYMQSYHMVTQKAADEAYRTVLQSSKYVDIEQFTKLTSQNDENTAYYTEQRNSLIKMRELSGAKHIFTMKKTEDGKFMYVVDGSSEEDISHIGDTEESGLAYYLTNSFSKKELRKKDEFGILANSLDGIRNNFKTIIGKINASSQQVAETALQLTAASNESARTVEEVSNKIQDIAKSSILQTGSTREGTGQLALLSEVSCRCGRRRLPGRSCRN